MTLKHRAVRFYKNAEMTAKVIATFTAIIAALAFLCPWFGGWVSMVTAERFGVEGYAFYEVAPDWQAINSKNNPDGPDAKIDYTTTHIGNFFAPRSKSRKFEDIEAGDIIQAKEGGGYLHERDDKDSPYVYLFRDGECALVIKRDKPEPLQSGYDGGWLKVVTAACGLFK